MVEFIVFIWIWIPFAFLFQKIFYFLLNLCQFIIYLNFFCFKLLDRQITQFIKIVNILMNFEISRQSFNQIKMLLKLYIFAHLIEAQFSQSFFKNLNNFIFSFLFSNQIFFQLIFSFFFYILYLWFFFLELFS